MKKIFITWIIIMSMVSQGFSFLTFLTDTAKLITGAINEVNEELFRKTMIANTIESVAYLRKNYEETRRFYKEIEYISKNPLGASMEIYRQIEARVTNPVDEFWSRTEFEKSRKKSLIEQAEDKALEQTAKGVRWGRDKAVAGLNWLDKETAPAAAYADVETQLKLGYEYIKKHLEFGDKAANKITQQDKEFEVIVKDIKDISKIYDDEKIDFNNQRDVELLKAKLEGIKNRLELLQVEQLALNNKILLKLMEVQTAKAEKEYLDAIRVYARHKAYTDVAKEIINKRKLEQKDIATREQKVKKILSSTSESEAGLPERPYKFRR